MAVTNYVYRYGDGSTGNTPWRADAQGRPLLNEHGGYLDEGVYQGRAMPDGSINRSPLGNVNSNGMVDLYNGYQTTADNFYSSPNVGQRPPDGYGYGTSAQQPAPQAPGVPQGGAPGGGSLGLSGSISQAGQNPYLKQMGDVLTQQMTDNFQTRVAPAIRSQAMAAGGYGGSRQGVMEANAANDLNQQIGSALTNLYGQGYNTSLKYDLGLRGNALGFGQLGLGYANLDRNINNDNWANQMQGVNLGLNIYDRLNANNQQAIGAGQQIQNTPLDYWQQFSQGANSIGQGYGTQTQQGPGGNPWLGALGGAQLGGQIANWWGGGNSSYNPGPMGNAMADNSSWFNAQVGL